MWGERERERFYLGPKREIFSLVSGPPKIIEKGLLWPFKGMGLQLAHQNGFGVLQFTKMEEEERRYQ